MSHTVIVSPDVVGPIRNGGIGTFVYHFARLLRANNHRVTVIFAGHAEVPGQSWHRQYEAAGISVLQVTETPVSPNTTGESWFLRRSQAAVQAIPADADIVYTQDWGAVGFAAVRTRRFSAPDRRIFVTVLHSPSNWARRGMEQFLTSDDALSLDFAERYVTEHSDRVVSPSGYMLEWVRSRGWKIPADSAVLGLPFLPQPIKTMTAPAATQFRRLVFYGRLETRKGFDLFVDSLLKLKPALDEVVFLGKESEHAYGTWQNAAAKLHELDNRVTAFTEWDSREAQEYLASAASDTLVVMPSLVDNFPYAVIEASLIPGLHLIAANTGGIPEILGTGTDSLLFEPTHLVETLRHWLKVPPASTEVPTAYDWRSHNQAWLDFHESLVTDRSAPVVVPISVRRETSVDVCIPYYNHGQYLPQTLQALEQQTVHDFNVFVVNDCSNDDESNRVFEAMRQGYPSWSFVSNEANRGLSYTRNHAASLGSADHLLFVDADNVPVPTMVERFCEAIHWSGDDCLTCYLLGFEGDEMPFRLRADGTFTSTAPVLYRYHPLGGAAVLGLFNNIFGDANFIVRRHVFEVLGGFSLNDAHAGFEDYEFLARLTLAGYRQDVIPEYLVYYRYLVHSLLRTTNPYTNIMRVQDVYREQLAQTGLAELADFAYGLYLRSQGTTGGLHSHEVSWLANQVHWFVLRDALLLKITKHLPWRNRPKRVRR